MFNRTEMILCSVYFAQRCSRYASVHIPKGKKNFFSKKVVNEEKNTLMIKSWNHCITTETVSTNLLVETRGGEGETKP